MPAPSAQAADLSGRDVDVVHIVGGGSQNELLCQLTADAAGLPVLAGPVEATALGNVLVQARSPGRRPTSLEAIRAELLVRCEYDPRRCSNRLVKCRPEHEWQRDMDRTERTPGRSRRAPSPAYHLVGESRVDGPVASAASARDRARIYEVFLNGTPGR